MSQAANSTAAAALVEEFARCGVRHACISPGSRSTPVVTALAASSIRIDVILDERSAAFYALGMARECGLPTLLLCTSGTAAANYMPAVAEAFLSQVPLIVLTADRPPELRDCHAPQTIDQVRLYGSHVRFSVDAAAPAAGVDLVSYFRALACRLVSIATASPRGPVHLNLPMREPLIDVAEQRGSIANKALAANDTSPAWTTTHAVTIAPAPQTVESLRRRLSGVKRGLVVCGPGLQEYEREPIARLARTLAWPILADPLSQLRFGRHDRSLVVDAYEIMLRKQEFCARARPQAIIQFGRPLTSKAFSQFVSRERIPFYLMVAPPSTWPDPNHCATDVLHADPLPFCAALTERACESDGSHDADRWSRLWLGTNTAIRESLQRDLGNETEMFEGKIFSELIAHLPDHSALIVGNSMPVRDLDLFGASSPREIKIACNRGANGIDGVLSAALGTAALRHQPTVLVEGDLSFLHDMGALQIARTGRINLIAVVINNDGGGIFSFLSQAGLGPSFEPYFGTPHGLELAPAVTMVGGRHMPVASWSEFGAAIDHGLEHGALTVIEVRSGRARNVEKHRGFIARALSNAGLGGAQ